MSIVLDGTVGITGAVNLTTTGNTILGDASTDTLNVGNGGLVKDASGNVGIGTASPASALFVSANTATGGVPEINLENSQNFEAANFTNYKTELIFRGDKQNRYSSSGAILGPLASIATKYSNATLTSDSQQGAGALVFSTRAATATTSSDTLTEAMRIDSSGNVMIGTTTANTYTTGLAVDGQISAQANGLSAVSLVNVCRNYNSGSNIFSFALPNAPSSTSTANVAQTWMINIWCYGDTTHGEINTLLVTFYGPTGITVTSLQQQIIGGTSAGITYTRIANAGGDLLQMSGNNYSRIKSVNIVQLGGN